MDISQGKISKDEAKRRTDRDETGDPETSKNIKTEDPGWRPYEIQNGKQTKIYHLRKFRDDGRGVYGNGKISFESKEQRRC